MRLCRTILPWLLACVISTFQTSAQETAPKQQPQDILTGALLKIANLVEPPSGAAAQTFSAQLKIARADGIAKELAGRTADLAFQAPDRARLSAALDGHSYTLGRDGQKLWIHASEKQFGVIGAPGRPRFLSAPDKVDTTQLKPIKLPLPKEQVALLPLLMKVELLPEETLDDAKCQVLKATPQPEALQAFKIPNVQFELWVRESDQLPARIGYADGKGGHLQIDLLHVKLEPAWPQEKWNLTAGPGDKIETVALSHVSRFLDVLLSTLGQKIPTLGPATGERRVLAREGQGRLELIDGTKVLLVKGSPEEMGRQQGALMKKEIRDLTDHILYGVGVGSSFAKGSWFFGEIDRAQNRLNPFMNERYLREMDALASAAGLEKEEVQLANFFPELFHCSGFALYGEATVGGRMYHGRILDYLKGVGLEQNAVVMVFQPDQGNAWVNVGYAGFIGSVTAMNEKHMAIGEMGGRGEGNWDGKPMAQLVREVMEKANTLDEAVEIMRKGPRTCEYYYVLSDGKSKRAVGIKATPALFETIWPGEKHPQLPHAMKDAVLMSAGDRYETLAERVKTNYGKIDAEGARDLMTRPVCMTSNIHSALFAPETLDFWVANADSKNVASHARFTHYNLADLLKSEAIKQSAAR